MSKIDSEVPALISAVLEYKKFRQLACYSIECVTKVVSPQNRDYKRNLQIAFSANAPKCVVEVLRVHMDKEDCLLVCVDCLHKLAVDTDNAEAIAREGGVRAVLASIGAIPTITEDALCEAMAILDKLCNHKRALEILADNENVGAVIDLVRRKSASSKVKVNCMRALDKLTRLPKGVESFIHCNGIPELLTLVADYKIKCASTEFDEVDLETLTTATKILLRLCKHSSTVVDQLMAANGAEVYVGVLGSLTDMPAGQLQDPESGGPLDTKDCGFSRLAAKLISNMYTGRISELVKSLKNSSQLNEFTLNLMGSLAMDASSSAGIVNNGGIEILLLGCCGDSSSTKILEVSTRAMSRLAGNVSNLEGLVGQGAVEGLVTALISPQGSTASAADAVLGLTLMCSTGEYVDRVYSAGGLSAVLTCISGVANSVEGDELRQKEIIMAGLSFLEHIAGASLDGDGQQSMLLSMSKNDLWVILTIIEKYHSDVPLVTRAIRVVTAYVKANLAHSLLETDGSCVAVIPLCIALLSEHAMFNDSENVSASDSAVGLVDEVLQLLNALLLVTAEVKSNHESIRTSQARVVDQQRALHATPTWKAAANELVEQGDGVVNLAILGFLERTAILSSIDSMDTFKMYSAVSLGRCTPLVALWADGGAKGNPSPIPLLAEQTAAFAQNWSDGSFEVNGRTKALIAAHSAVVSLGLFASVCPGHPALAMLASEQVIEKLFFLLYALMNSPLTAAMCEGPESGLVGSLVSATCLSSVHIIGALHMQLCVPGDVMSEEAFLQLLGDPLSAAQLCVDVLQSSTLGTMSNSLQALRLLWILKRIATQLVSPHLVSSGGIEALSAILKATGPMAAAAANSVQADVGFRTVVTVVHIVANLFDGIASLKGSIDGARELSRRGGVKACIASFIDPLGAVGVKDSPATTSSDGEVILGASKSIDDRTLSYSTQCADAALLFLYSLEQVARLGHDECAILSKLGCVLLFFRLCDRFEGNADIFDTTNRIVQLLVAPEDMLAILDSIKTKYAPACVATTLFGSRCSSDGMEKAIREVNRLCHFMGLVPMVEAFLAHDGFATMQACIGNSIAAIATARSASGPVDLLQLRGNFLNACVRVLCRSAATGLLDDSWSDVTDATAKLVCEHLLLILKKANEDPRSVDSVTLVETLQSIARMAITMPTSASLFYSGGATGLLVKRIQLSCMDASGGGLFEAQVMELSVAALAAIAQSCAYSYDYLLSTSKLIRQICSCITEYIQETGGVGLAPWITMTIAFLSKIFAVLHACTAGDEEAVCGQGGAPPVAVLLQVLRTAGSDIFGVLLTLKGSQLSSVIKPSTSIMDTLTNILLSSLNLGVALTDEDIVVIKDAFADGDIKSATCFDICATLLTTEVTAIPKCTQLMRRVWLSSNGILMQDAKKKRELEAQMQSYLALLRAFAGVSGGRFVTANSTARGRIRKMLNQTGVGKLLISILSGSADLSDSLRDDVEATLSLLSDEEYGENAVQTFAEYITTLANNLTPEGYVECAINRIKTGAPDLGEGEEDAETILKALKNTLKLLQRYMQRGTHLNTSDILTLAAAALTVSRKLFDINNHIESSGYDDISRHHAPDLVGRQGAVLDMLGHSLQILQKLFGAFAQIDSETLATSFDFVAVLGLVNDGLVWYVASLERQYEAKTSKQSSLALAIKADFTEVLRVSGMVLSSVLELCTTFDRSRRQGVCEAVLTMGLANNLHKISSLNGSCSGIIFYPSAASPSFVSDIKAIASKVLTVLHDSLLVDAEILSLFYPMLETQTAFGWRMCDMHHTSAQAVQTQRRTSCLSWLHVACGTEALGDALLGLLNLLQSRLGVGQYCVDICALYTLDIDGAIAFLLHALAEYSAQGVTLSSTLSVPLLELIVARLKNDDSLFPLLAHNVSGAYASESSTLALASCQKAVDALVVALVADVRLPRDGVSWALSTERMKYNRTISLGALTKAAAMAGANPDGLVPFPLAMIDAGIIDVIHEALISPLLNTDEEVVQSLMYLLCTLVELGYVDLNGMPKDTRKMINNLLMHFPANEYLSNISFKMFQSLTEIFAKGPDAELEATYARIAVLQSALGAVVEVRDPTQQKCYFYDGATGESSWTPNGRHLELLQELDTALHIIDGALKGDVSNANLSEEACAALIALLNSHYSDVRVLGRVLRIVQAQMAVPAQRDIYGLLDITGAVPYDLLAYSKLDRSWDTAGSRVDPVTVAITMLKDLSEQPAYQNHISLRDYIIFLNDYCISTTQNANTGTENFLLKALSTLVNMCRSNPVVLDICFEINVPITVTSVVSSPWLGNELQNNIQSRVGTSRSEDSVAEEIMKAAVSLATSLISGSNDRRSAVCVACSTGFLTLLSYLTIELRPPGPLGPMTASSSGGPTATNSNLLLVVLRLLGVFSSSDACAWYMLYKLSMVTLLKDRVLKYNMHSTAIIVPSLNILANMASVEASDGEGLLSFDASEVLPMASVILANEGGFEVCIGAIKRYLRNVDVIASGAAVLLNACPDQDFDEDGVPLGLSEAAVSIFDSMAVLNVCELLVKAFEFCVSEGETRSSDAGSAHSTSFVVARLLSMLTVSEHMLGLLSTGDLCSELVHIIVDVFRSELAARADEVTSAPADDSETTFVASLDLLLMLVRSREETRNNVYMCSVGLVDLLLEILKGGLSRPAVLLSTLSMLGIIAGISEIISTEIAENGMHLFIRIVEDRLHVERVSGDQYSAIVTAVFSILAVLVSTEANIRPLIRCGGFELLIKSLGVYAKDADVMMAAVVALDLIAAAEDEYLMVFLQKGGIVAVKKVLDNQEPGSEVYEAATSLHLALSARERLLMSSGSKTSRGALLARLKDGLVDVDAMMHEEEVTATKVELIDPEVLKKHRNILKAGQILVDYSPPTNANGSGGGNAIKRHMQLASDFEALVMKDTIKKSVKGGRRVPLRNLRIVSPGLGPGHYQRMLTGKLKPVAKAEYSFYISSIKPEDAIYIECQSEADRDRWVEAISSCLIAYRHQFEELKEIMSN